MRAPARRAWVITPEQAAARDALVARQFVDETVALIKQGMTDTQVSLVMIARGWDVPLPPRVYRLIEQAEVCGK